MNTRADGARPRRVLITGIGPVSPIGTGVDTFATALFEGASGISRVTRFDPSELPVKVAGEVRDFDPEHHLGVREARRTDRFLQMGLVAAQLAWEDAGKPSVEPPRGGVIFSTGMGGLQTILDQYELLGRRGARAVSAFTVPAMMANSGAGRIAIEFGLRGPNMCVSTACASSAHAIGEAFRLIQSGRLDLCVAGGSEAVLVPITFAAFAQMRALSRNPDPATASRPFDARRDGFVLSEGACVVVLEAEERVRERRARAYAEVAGYGATADAYHMTAPDPAGTGAAEAMRGALQDAGEAPGAVDYINAHGTSTPLNDAAETRTIKEVLGPEKAYATPVSSTKSMVGHMLGAAGAIETAATALAVERGLLPPTINHRERDPECDLDYVVEGARAARVAVALCNSFGFGGHNAVLALRAPTESDGGARRAGPGALQK